jgi:hypothetical protein
MTGTESIYKKALMQINKAVGTDGVIYGAVQINKGSCVAIFTQQYRGKPSGVIRQLLYGNEDSDPVLTKKGLNASSDEWRRILDVLRNAKHVDLRQSDFLELLKLPVDKTNNAVQVYSHIYRDEVRLVIGRIYNYKSYTGKGSGASVQYSEIDKLIEYLEKMTTGLETCEKDTSAKPRLVATEIKPKNINNNIDYRKIQDELFN